MSKLSSTLRVVGSLWFAACLLVLLLVAMACATVFESMRNSEQALALFYRSWWFQYLLGLVALNLIASVIVRYPFNKRLIGFVVTHLAIVVIMAGALTTKYLGIDGQIGLFEGQSTDSLTLPGRGTLTLFNRTDQTKASVRLAGSAFAGFEVVDEPEAPVLSLGETSVEVLRYLPDSVAVTRMVNDNPDPRDAVQISLSSSGEDRPVWLFAGQSQPQGPLQVRFRTVRDEAELASILDPPPPEANASKGTVRIELGGDTYDLALEACLDSPAAVGETGYTVRVLRYLPHATVGQDNKLTSLSDNPVNPAIEAEITGPQGSEKRLAFARFPEFSSIHGKQQIEGLKLTFISKANPAPEAPVEILKGPDDRLYVRFSPRGGKAPAREIKEGDVLESPWAGLKLSLLRWFDHARSETIVVPVDPVRKNRTQAVLVKMTAGEHNHQLWIQKYRSRSPSLNDKAYELTYTDEQFPLGFSVKLNKFTVGHYPGTQRPRTFESQISIIDANSGRTVNQVVSMNHPAKYAGFTFYQSSYRMEGNRTASYLSVSRDPGQLIVFAGYFLLMAGMIVTLITRMKERRLIAQTVSTDADRGGRLSETTAGTGPADGGRRREPVSLPVQ
jgi:hypothetical protein